MESGRHETREPKVHSCGIGSKQAWADMGDDGRCVECPVCGEACEHANPVSERPNEFE